jgi:hypothetical protein
MQSDLYMSLTDSLDRVNQMAKKSSGGSTTGSFHQLF